MCDGGCQKRYMNAEEVAAYLGIVKRGTAEPDAAAVYARVSRRELPHVRMGRLTRFDRQEIDRWMEAQAVKAVDISA